MATGRDVAKFVTQITGDNYLALYDEAEAYNDKLKTEVQQKFKGLVERMNMVGENNKREVID